MSLPFGACQTPKTHGCLFKKSARGTRKFVGVYDTTPAAPRAALIHASTPTLVEMKKIARARAFTKFIYYGIILRRGDRGRGFGPFVQRDLILISFRVESWAALREMKDKLCSVRVRVICRVKTNNNLVILGRLARARPSIPNRAMRTQPE